MSLPDWRRLARAVPGPLGCAVWLGAALVAPPIIFNAAQRWEESPSAGAGLWWAVAVAPAVAAVAAARWTAAGTAAGAAAAGALPRAAATGVLVAAGSVALAVAWYRWVIPFDGRLGWSVALGPPALREAGAGPLIGAVLAVLAGGLIGGLVRHGRVPRGRRGGRRPAGRRYVVGAALAAVGAFAAPLTVRIGAQDSTAWYRDPGYGPDVVAGRAVTVTVPAAGRYAVYAMGFAPRSPDCRFTGADGRGRSATRVPNPPGDYGGDFASYTWIAWVDLPAAGPYTVLCRTSDVDAAYLVGDPPRIRGAVGALVHVPTWLLALAGAVPGGLVALAARRARVSVAGRPGPAATAGGSRRT